MVKNPHGIESVKKIPSKQNPSLPKRVLVIQLEKITYSYVWRKKSGEAIDIYGVS